jgi:hypothetical protein
VTATPDRVQAVLPSIADAAFIVALAVCGEPEESHEAVLRSLMDEAYDGLLARAAEIASRRGTPVLASELLELGYAQREELLKARLR